MAGCRSVALRFRWKGCSGWTKYTSFVIKSWWKAAPRGRWRKSWGFRAGRSGNTSSKPFRNVTRRSRALGRCGRPCGRAWPHPNQQRTPIGLRVRSRRGAPDSNPRRDWAAVRCSSQTGRLYAANPAESRNRRIASRNPAIWFQLGTVGDATKIGSVPVTKSLAKLGSPLMSLPGIGGLRTFVTP